MIAGLSDFVKRFKQVTESHISIYDGSKSKLLVWQGPDFDTKKVLSDIDQTNALVNNGILKKAYDTIRTYDRVHKVYLKSREDYYRSAILDRRIDILVMDTIANNLHKVNNDLNNG